jgi:hypothetical protein
VTPISLGIFASANQSAGATSYESISTITVGSGGSSSVTFSGVPSTYQHLQIRAFVVSTTAFWFQTQINSDTSTGYASHALYANGSIVSTLAAATGVASYGYTGLIEDNGQSALVIDFLDYKDTNKNKTVRCLWGNDRNGAGNIGINSFFRPSQTGAITDIKISGTFSQNSHFALYGIRSA